MDKASRPKQGPGSCGRGDEESTPRKAKNRRGAAPGKGSDSSRRCMARQNILSSAGSFVAVKRAKRRRAVLGWMAYAASSTKRAIAERARSVLKHDSLEEKGGLPSVSASLCWACCRVSASSSPRMEESAAP
eukprot:scaffold305752_cov30-Tisochrysis_lutea.AAC.8